MTEQLPEDHPQRRREYSGPGSTLGVAALVVIVVGAALWWFEFRDTSGSGRGDDGDSRGIVALLESMNPTGQSPAAREGRAAPNFLLDALEGEPISLSDLRGRYVLVNFWASWCGPCRGETPDLQDFHVRTLNKNITVVGVNQQEDVGTARRFVEEFAVDYPILFDFSGEVSAAYAVGVGGLPRTFLVNPEGVVERVYLGRITDEQLRDIEESLP
jgi:cytochrome c biogenesis protein CcmG, thiol:disulfide interchange protein DsbE